MFENKKAVAKELEPAFKKNALIESQQPMHMLVWRPLISGVAGGVHVSSFAPILYINAPLT